ncbi:hypothetical protein F8510_29230 [Bacillus sp. RM2(2019)]|nr:hypothetical protein F8510_29230 [Bacillus sp. RM2(2019)]
MRVIGYPFFPFGRKGGDIPMEFLFELLKKFVKAVVGEASAYVFRKRQQNPHSSSLSEAKG